MFDAQDSYLIKFTQNMSKAPLTSARCSVKLTDTLEETTSTLPSSVSPGYRNGCDYFTVHRAGGPA